MEHNQKPDHDSNRCGSAQSDDDPVRLISDQIGIWLALASHYLNLRADMVRLKALKRIAHAALIFLALLLSCAFVVYAGVQVMQGIAGALNSLFGTNGWPGTLVTGLLFITILFGVWYVVYTKARVNFRNKLRHKYEQRAIAHRRRNGSRTRENGRAVRIPVSGGTDANHPAGHGGHDHGP